MKLLIGLSNVNFINENYKMCIVEVDEIPKEKPFKNNWVDLDINKLQECDNIKVNVNNFKSITQNPEEYIEASFNINKLINWNRKEEDFQITNVYYDEKNQPQLYRVVNSSGNVFIQDISELEYSERSSLYGKFIEDLPNFVRKEPLFKAYDWWKKNDECEKKVENTTFSNKFEIYGNMPVKLFYHYLIGVRGFKIGYHTATELIKDDYEEIYNEYMLYKGTANIKLSESLPKEQNQNLYSFNRYSSDINLYPDSRKIRYYGVTMSMMCSKENFPTNVISKLSTISTSGENSLDVTLNCTDGLMHIYNQMEENGCIKKDWHLDEYNSFFGMTEYNMIPSELAYISYRLQSEKEGTTYKHTMSISQDHWSISNTQSWTNAIGLALSVQYYSPELKERIMPILKNAYQNYYNKCLNMLIKKMGLQDALEVMKWTKEASKKIMNTIFNVAVDGSIQKSNVETVNQMSELFTLKKNNYDLPDWLQVYSSDTIEALGGVELLKQAIAIKGEEREKELITFMAESIEAEQKEDLPKRR